MPRLDISHIMNYQLDNHHYFSICGKKILISPTMITLAADNTYPGLCSDCKINSDNYILYDLNNVPRIARNSFQQYLYQLREFIQDEIYGTIVVESKYFLDSRKWSKLEKLKKFRKT